MRVLERDPDTPISDRFALADRAYGALPERTGGRIADTHDAPHNIIDRDFASVRELQPLPEIEQIGSGAFFYPAFGQRWNWAEITIHVDKA